MKSIISFFFISISLFSIKTIAQNKEVEYANNRLILKLKTPYESILQNRSDNKTTILGIAEVDILNIELGCKEAQFIKGGGIVRSIVLEFKTPIDIQKAIESYKNTGKFEYVEPDFIGHGDGVQECSPDIVPNDTYFSRQWGLKNDGTFTLTSSVTGNDIKAVDAWDITTGSTKNIICILDSGCKLDHPEFTGRIWQNSKEIANNGIDDDKNGKIDDIQGWDFANNDKDPTDDHGHGTNVTGILGASGNNSIGYSGVDWKSQLMVIKALDANNSGLYSWWESGIYYAVDNGAKVINMSVVGNSNSSSLEAAVNYAWNKGVIIVACMGNDNVGVSRYPASFNNLIAVGSVNPNGKRSVPFSWSATSGSNYGSHIDVCAPGNYIYGLSYNSNTSFNTYWSGTSQATPHATGLAGLMIARNTTLTPAQIKDYMQKGCDDLTGDPTEDVAGFDNYYGWGRINAKKTLNLIPASSATLDLNNESAQLMVSPNPSKGIFTLSTPSILRGAANIEIFNLTGQIVYQKSISSASELQMDIDLSAQAKGIYIVHVKSDAAFMTKKVVVD
jgi:thermitase